jgi:Zn-finger nucleic acid-binding protein
LWADAAEALLHRDLDLEIAELHELARSYAGKSLNCPCCIAKMSPLQLKGESVDLCLGCGALWLDPGEIQAITRRTRGLPEPPQTEGIEELCRMEERRRPPNPRVDRIFWILTAISLMASVGLGVFHTGASALGGLTLTIVFLALANRGGSIIANARIIEWDHDKNVVRERIGPGFLAPPWATIALDNVMRVEVTVARKGGIAPCGVQLVRHPGGDEPPPEGVTGGTVNALFSSDPQAAWALAERLAEAAGLDGPRLAVSDGKKWRYLKKMPTDNGKHRIEISAPPH